MRPPSYYASFVANNNANYLGASSSTQNTSYQLRSSFSSPSSAAYASRTHLPYVAQSALVAHCFTSGSSTKPYGGQPRSSYGSLTSGPHSSHKSTSVLRTPAAASSRPRSTKLAASLGSSVGSSYLGAGPATSYRAPASSPLPRPSYLSAQSSSSRSSYRPNASSYYKPIRLRERPLLNQLVRSSVSPVGAPEARPIHSEAAAPGDSGGRTLGGRASGAKSADDELWSRDVARNISRNKYLIKFREFEAEQKPGQSCGGGGGRDEACDRGPAVGESAPESRPGAADEPRATEAPEEASIRDQGATPARAGERAPAKRRNVRLKLQATRSKGRQLGAPDDPATGVGGQLLGAAEAPASPAPHQVASAGAGAQARIRFREYQLDDFNFLTVLGHGGWGFVVLAELKQHDACFAVKCIKKLTIVEDDDFDSIMIERKVLALGNEHPFICKLFCTFQTPGYLFFAMEFCAGGDLMFHVQREGKFSEPRCRFYAAEIICAIRFLHGRHIIYRDLKLDNILLDAAGHIRLVDFGMCQCRSYREEMLPSNFCGTPEYISPEIIKGVPYNHSVDWWSFGVLLYEMAVGKMPFRGGDENELLWNVCYEQIHYPMFLSGELRALLQQLLEREPSKRMGMATCKSGDIRQQPFFRALDWRAVEQVRVQPPFVPQVDSRRDVRNFERDFTQSACALSPVDQDTLGRLEQAPFRDFAYTNPSLGHWRPRPPDPPPGGGL